MKISSLIDWIFALEIPIKRWGLRLATLLAALAAFHVTGILYATHLVTLRSSRVVPVASLEMRENCREFGAASDDGERERLARRIVAEEVSFSQNSLFRHSTVELLSLIGHGMQSRPDWNVDVYGFSMESGGLPILGRLPFDRRAVATARSNSLVAYLDSEKAEFIFGVDTETFLTNRFAVSRYNELWFSSSSIPYVVDRDGSSRCGYAILQAQ